MKRHPLHHHAPTLASGGGFSRRRFIQGFGGGLAVASLPAWAAPRDAEAAPFCPHPNPIVNENHCMGSGSEGFRISDATTSSAFGGFAAQTSYDRGENVVLRVDGFIPAVVNQVQVKVYRLGCYNGAGGRLVYTHPSLVALPNSAPTALDQFGLRRMPTSGPGSTGSVTIPAANLPCSGVYLAKLIAYKDGSPVSGRDTQAVFVVRDDSRARDLLVVMPTNSWQAYNQSLGKSLYYYNSDNSTTAGYVQAPDSGGRRRAVKNSFDRFHLNVGSDYNWVLRTEYPLIFWLEQMGYDLAYTDDVAFNFQPEQLLPAKTKTVVIAGHSEYWTKGMRDNLEAARNAGTNIASFSANTGYWQVRYEKADQSGAATGIADARTLVCFKTVEGSVADGTLGVNDFGPGNPAQAAATSAVGLDGNAGTADDHPEFATTTFRDPGAPPGDPNAPNSASGGHGRVGPDRPENALFGVLFLGDNDTGQHALTIPAGSGNGGEFTAHPAWRHCELPTGSDTQISKLVGWEWDAIPSAASPLYASAAARQPAGVKRLSETVLPAGGSREFLLDHGRVYSTPLGSSSPPPGQPGVSNAITYKAPSGALVFASGTMQWSWGLGPHYRDGVTAGADGQTYADPRVDDSNPNLQQATYNLLVDGGVKPATPTPNIVADATPTTPTTPPGEPPGPTPDTTPPALTLAPARVRLSSSGTVRVRITCPADEVRGAEGTITLTTASAVHVTAHSRRRRKVRLASGGFQVLGGRTLTLDLKLSTANRALLNRLRTVKVIAVVKAADAAGNHSTKSTPLTLLGRRPAPKHR